MNIGTAAWTIPKTEINSFSPEGAHLERYSKIFSAVEINTSFYKDHLPKSYEKWSAVTPENFSFSVKLNQRFTHTCDDFSTIDLISCLETISQFREKWKVLLVQFPAGKNFEAFKINKMYKVLRKRFEGIIALEPRNLTWASKESIELMSEYDITKVTADPEKCPTKTIKENTKYIRLHGSPDIYRSSYSEEYLEDLYIEISSLSKSSWCIFDNTTFGHATTNALFLRKKFQGELYGRTQFHEDRTPTLHAPDEHREY